jgi:ABC-type phosphate transport system substrate-binding protein
MKLTPWFYGSMVLVFTAVTAVAAAEPIYIITGKIHPTPLAKQEVLDIFKGAKRKLNDKNIEILNQSSSSEIREEFYKKLYSKTSAEINTQWAELIFSGKAKAPVTLNDEHAIIEYIKAQPDAIGYIRDKSVLDKNIAVVFEVQ